MLTGQYPPRHGVYTVVDERYAPAQAHMKVLSTRGNDELPDSTVTLAKALKQNGYDTALIGMWNLGRGRNGTPGSPTGQGFETYRRPDDFGFAKDAYHDAQDRYLSDALAGARAAEAFRGGLHDLRERVFQLVCGLGAGRRVFLS